MAGAISCQSFLPVGTCSLPSFLLRQHCLQMLDKLRRKAPPHSGKVAKAMLSNSAAITYPLCTRSRIAFIATCAI